MSPFFYDSYSYDVRPDGLHIIFSFQYEEHLFQPTAHFVSRDFLHPEQVDKTTLDTLVFNIGMIELVSYWKAFCPPEVIVKPHRLTQQQIAFWKKLYYNGLGEFFYTNKIEADPEKFINITCERKTENFQFSIFNFQFSKCWQYIVPIGGGKDSVVTLELLKNSSGLRPIPLIMNPRGATVECIERAGYTIDDVLVIHRTIDPHLLEVNRQGALNGHTPFSAMLAFYTLLAATLTLKNCRIALSNENSANESTVIGTYVNHQYSKSLEFENDFREYVSHLMFPESGSPSSVQHQYYSFLRPLSELQIASLFSCFPHYFDVFKSCNVGSKSDIWCGHCAKCLFAYIILSPFIHPDRLKEIFGKNMLDDITLRHEFDQLTGQAETKPFECVGTVGEVNSALSMTIAKWYPAERPALLAEYRPQPVTTPLDSFFADHNLPDDDFETLKSAFRNSGMTEHFVGYSQLFNLLAGKVLLVAGFGREGKSTLSLLQRMFPNRSWDVAENDEAIKTALEKKRYDLVFKSPGIPLTLFDGLCEPSVITSQSDIFLQVYGDRTIGVTGTKGKSTTVSLIAAVLLQYSKTRQSEIQNSKFKIQNSNVVLAGNIGLPLFETIAQITGQTTVVAELSCHQLEIIHRAPHVSIILNLFQEHLDHYKSYDDYKLAKLQIALCQQPDDHFFYCADNADLADMVDRYRHQLVSHLHPLSQKETSAVSSFPSRLAGKHNLFNILAAYRATAVLGVDDDAFRMALQNFNPLEHRLEPVATIEGVTYVNDSISTIPQATIAAIEAIGNVETLILGGFDRGIDYAPLAHFLLSNPLGQSIRNLALLGTAGRTILQQLNNQASNFKIFTHFDSDYSMEEAVAFAVANTQRGHSVLLSPAASSYDHYKNFEYRGRHFKDIVNELKTENGKLKTKN